MVCYSSNDMKLSGRPRREVHPEGTRGHWPSNESSFLVVVAGIAGNNHQKMADLGEAVPPRDLPSRKPYSPRTYVSDS
jgi:hypothetical protein